MERQTLLIYPLASDDTTFWTQKEFPYSRYKRMPTCRTIPMAANFRFANRERCHSAIRNTRCNVPMKMNDKRTS